MFYPDDAPVPDALRAEEFLLRPLRATDVQLDYEAVISSRAELLLGSGGTWPREGFTIEENLADLERHEQEHHDRVAFTYTIMSPAESECLGCAYINPPERIVGPDEEGGEYLSDGAAFVDFRVRHNRLVDGLNGCVLQALIPWFQNEWAFSQVMFERGAPDSAVRGDGAAVSLQFQAPPIVSRHRPRLSSRARLC